MKEEKRTYEKPELDIIEVEGDITLNSVDVDYEDLF